MSILPEVQALVDEVAASKAATHSAVAKLGDLGAQVADLSAKLSAIVPSDPIDAEDSHYVGIDGEARAFLRHIIRDDQIEMLALELVARAGFEVARLGREPNQNAIAFLRGDTWHLILDGRHLEHQAFGILLELVLRDFRGTKVRDRRRHHQCRGPRKVARSFREQLARADGVDTLDAIRGPHR